jgi:hypothetical protein
MATFKDATGWEWSVRFTAGMLLSGRLKDAGLDLNAAASDPAGLAVLDNPEVLVKVLWVMADPQPGMTLEQFADAIDGPTRFAAVDAIQDAFLDFCQRPAVARAMKERLPAAIARIETEAIDGLTGSQTSAPSSPASPDSTPHT